MTLGEWLEQRTPEPPPALRARLSAVLGPSLHRGAAEAPDLLLEAAERLLAALLRQHATSRDSALDLLTADALVTYAFEAAAESSADLPARASAAMARIAALGAEAA